MKTLLALALTLVSLQSYSAVVIRDLLHEEIELSLQLVEKYDVPMVVNGPCTKHSFEVVSNVRGFNPANWSLISEKKTHELEGEEIMALIDLIDRVKAPLIHLDPITTESRVTIQGASCGFSPNQWTVSFDDQN